MEAERKIEILLKFVDAEITHNANDAYSNISDVDYALEEESTVDGYGVYTFKHPDDEVCISENLYYYDSDLTELIVETLLDGDIKIYIDEYMYEDLYIKDELEISFDEFAEDIIEQAIQGFLPGMMGDIIITEQEIEELKEEYEYEDEDTETA